MPQIKPIKELRNTKEISEICHNTDEPIFITKNGYGDLVVMSVETYDRSIAKLDLYQKLAEAENEIKNEAELLEGEHVFSELRGKYGEK